MEKPKIIYIIPYAHCDNAWSHTRRWHEDRYTQIFTEVLDIMKQNPDYTWYFDTAFEELSPFARRHPERLPELRKRIIEGRIVVAPTAISNPAIDSVGAETFIRNIVYGRRYFQRHFGVTSDVYTANDLTPGHAQIPQVLLKGGYKFYRFTRPSNNPLVDFYWRGLDGTEILASRGDYGYGALADNNTFPHDFKINWHNAADTIYRDIENRFAIIYKGEKPVETVDLSSLTTGNSGIVWFPRGGDDCRPLRALTGELIDLFGLIEEWKKRENVPIRFATPTEYFTELEKCRDILPVIPGVLDSSGCACRYGMLGEQSFVLWWLRNEYAITTAERMSTLASFKTGIRFPEEKIDRLWQDLLSTTGHAIRLAFTNDYDRLLAKQKAIRLRAEKLCKSAAGRITATVDHVTEGIPIAVWNTLAWDRIDVVRASMNFQRSEASSISLKDGKGNPVPIQVSNIDRHGDGSLKRFSFDFVAVVPSLGYATYYAETTETPLTEELDAAIEEAVAKTRVGNDFFDLVVENGNLRSMSLKKGGGNLLNPKKIPANAISFSTLEAADHYDTLGSFQDEFEESATKPVGVIRGDVCTKIVSRSNVGGHKVQKTITVYTTLQRIDFETEIDSLGGDGVFKTKFPLGFDGAIMAHIPFGVEERNLSKEPCRVNFASESYPDTFTAEKWLDYGNPQRGVAFFTQPGQRGFDFVPGERVLKHILLKSRTIPKKTCWRHISRYHERKGFQSVRYSVYPHTGNWKKAQVERRATEYHEPLICKVVDRISQRRTRPASYSFVQIAPDNIVMTAFTMQDRGIVARLYESHGNAVKVEMTLPVGVKRVVESDYYGEPVEAGRKIELQDRILTFEIRPWEIITLFVDV